MPKWLLISIEIVCVGVLLVGIALLTNIAVSLVIGGALGIWACESSPTEQLGRDHARQIMTRKARKRS